jgi:hypothetical protein
MLAYGAGGQEAGGDVGADFLLFPPAARTDAMGGVLDGLGNHLEGIYFNPSILSPISEFTLQVNVNPLPNDVTHSQAAIALPIFGGLAAVSGQFLNTGGFTYINPSGQAQETLAVFDAAAVVGYSRYIWKTVSAGLSAKLVYRALGNYSAVGFASDAGVSAWFETPHIGQRPKPPTREQLQKEFNREVTGIDREKEKRTEDAAETVASLRKEVASAEESLAKLEAKIAEAEEDKKEPLLADKATAETELQSLRTTLGDEEQKAREGLDAIDQWYVGELAAAQARYDGKRAELDRVESERARLFSVINDPEEELTDEILDFNIDASISKTGDFLSQRRTSLSEAEAAYRSKRNGIIEDLRSSMKSYQDQIDSETGPRASALTGELAALRQTLTSLANAETDEEKARAKETQNQIKAKEKELAGLLDDPWIKRLQKRISEKESEIGRMEEEILKKSEESERASGEAEETAAEDIQDFEDLRSRLKKELKKAKLKRELDLLEASSDRAMEKAQRDYKGKERKTYLNLLSALYSHEEKIFQARLTSVREDSDSRMFDFETEIRKTRETLEDDFAFESRFLSQKISQLKKEEGKEAELAAANDELSQKEEAYKSALGELSSREKSFDIDERAKRDSENAGISEERRNVRLIFLQTDTPYLNTSVVAGMRNAGSNMTFAEEGFPMPTTFTLGLGYAVLNTDNHSIKLSVEADFPLHDDISFSFGVEYGFAGFAFFRAGYALGAVQRSFSAGFGVDLTLGFSEYMIDYAFRPLPDYGLQHSFAIAIRL